MKTAVVALGKIGLPLAVQFADSGHEVVGVDVNPRQVELINAATEPFLVRRTCRRSSPSWSPPGS